MSESEAQELNDDGTTKEQNGLVQTDINGDPLPDERAIKMLERESYERMVDGLKIAAEAASHLARMDVRSRAGWERRRFLLDNVRKKAVAKAGVERALNFKETAPVEGEPMSWRAARARWKEGLKQASGAMRQMAVCWRQETIYSLIANQLDSLADQAKNEMVARISENGILLPPGYDA